MCGIIGTWAPHPLRDDARLWCRREIARLAHRGPEGQTTLDGPNYSLGHALLSFHDQASALQPYQSAEHDLTIVFNGEIYNYGPLRDDVLARGETLSTLSECELIALLWRLEGDEIFRRLRGMFALAIIDRRNDSLVLASDYIGKKPLYFTVANDEVRFASEAGPLQAAQSGPAIDLEVLSDYFSMSAVPAGLALMRGLRKVAPGEVVTVGRGGIRRYRYWSMNVVAAQVADTSLAESAARLERLLRQAVARRLRYEGDTLGLMLSGGLDSSLIASFAAEVADHPRRTTCFTATFDDDESGDFEHARAMASSLGLPHVAVHLNSADLNAGIDKFLAPLDEPIADPSLMAVAAITEKVRGEVKAFLTGDGADDLFMGYQLYRALGLLHAIEWMDPSGRISRRLVAAARLKGGGRDMGPTQVVQMLARAVGVADGAKFRAAASAFNAGELASILRPELAVHPASEPAGAGPEALRRGMLCDLLQARILPKLDRGSMMNGVEFRSPFLDQDVAEYALSLPTRHLLTGGKGKLILRHIARARLDASILARAKRGFRLPMDQLLRTTLRERLCDTLSPGAVARGGIFNPGPVADLLARHMQGKADLAKKLWSLFCLQLWQDTWGANHV